MEIEIDPLLEYAMFVLSQKFVFLFSPPITVSLLLYFIRPLVFIMQKVKTGTL